MIGLNQGLGNKYSRLKIIWHPEKWNSFLTGEVTAPIQVRIKPTNQCNHGCFYCVYEVDFSGIHPTINKKDMIPEKKMYEILNDLKDIGVKSVTYSGGGEPLCYPFIENSLLKTLDSGLDLSLLTNGQLLEGKVADILSNSQWLRVSADYCDEKMFKQIRKRPKELFYKWSKNMENFANLKNFNNSKCDFESNCVVHEHNYKRLPEIAKLFKNLGFDNLRFAPLWKENFEKYHAPIKEKVIENIKKAKDDFEDDNFKIGSTYEEYFDATGKLKRLYEKCFWMQVVPVIAADQNIYTCHNKAYDAKGIIGSLKNDSFKNLWYSEKTAEFFKNFNAKERCRHECSSDIKNIIIHELLSCADPHVVNFP